MRTYKTSVFQGAFITSCILCMAIWVLLSTPAASATSSAQFSSPRYALKGNQTVPLGTGGGITSGGNAESAIKTPGLPAAVLDDDTSLTTPEQRAFLAIILISSLVGAMFTILPLHLCIAWRCLSYSARSRSLACTSSTEPDKIKDAAYWSLLWVLWPLYKILAIVSRCICCCCTGEDSELDEEDAIASAPLLAVQSPDESNRKRKGQKSGSKRGRALYVSCKSNQDQPDYVERIRSYIVEDPNSHEYWEWSSGRYPLHWAAYHGNVNAARALIEAGADINAKDFTGITALHAAASNGRYEMVKYFLEQPSINRHAMFGSSWESSNIWYVFVGGTSSTALTAAAANGHSAIIELLVNSGGADINYSKCAPNHSVWSAFRDGFNKYSALGLAGKYGHVESVKQLLMLGAKPSHYRKSAFKECNYLVAEARKKKTEMIRTAQCCDIFISFRFEEAQVEAMALQSELRKLNITAFVCNELPGSNVCDAIISALSTCKFAIILATRTYGKQGSTQFSTKQELSYIKGNKDYFLVKMCDSYDVALAKVTFTEDIVYHKWDREDHKARQNPPADLIGKIVAKFLGNNIPTQTSH